MAVVTVAPSGYEGPADYYCTGVDDQLIINAAIQYVSSAYGGGTIHLMEGTYKISAAISSTASNITLEGSGPGTVLDSASTTDTIKFAGGTNIRVQNLRIIGTTVALYGIFFASVKNGSVNGLTINKTENNASIFIAAGLGTSIENNVIDGSLVGDTQWQYGIYVESTLATVANNTVQQIRTSIANSWGINIRTNSSGIVTNNHIYDLSSSSGVSGIGGIGCSTNYSKIINNRIEQVKNSATAANAFGISLSGTSNSITANYCYNNGSDTGIANTNGCNFSDAGTNTQVYSNSWQSPVAGEPSLGTPHPHYKRLVNGADPGAAGHVTVDCSGEVPVGANQIYIWMQFTGAAGDTVSCYTDSIPTPAGSPVSSAVKNAAVPENATGLIRLSATRTFVYYPSGGTVGPVYIDMHVWWG